MAQVRPDTTDVLSALSKTSATTEAHSRWHGRTNSIWENVLAHGADPTGTVDSTSAIQAAIDAVGTNGMVYFPAGTYNTSSSLTIYTGIRLVGAGMQATTIVYSGSGAAVAQSTPGTRIFSVGFEGMTLQGTASGTIGLDMASVSLGYFANFKITAFTTGIAMKFSSAVAGGCVYNTIVHPSIQGNATGIQFAASGSNENTVVGGRILSCTTRGVDLTNSNHNKLLGISFESNGVGVYLTSSTTDSDFNTITHCRFESNTTAIEVASSNVRDTQIFASYFSANTTTLTDSGTRTNRLMGASGEITATSPLAGASGTPFTFERSANGGSSIPAFIVRDSATASGTPITLQIETERSTGTQILAKRGSTTNFSVGASDGDTFIGGDVEIDGALNHDGTTVGFYGTTPLAKQTGVAVTAEGIHAALVALGLIGA